MIFPEAMKDEKEFEKVRKNTKVFLLANMTEFGKKSKLLNKKDLENFGLQSCYLPCYYAETSNEKCRGWIKINF